MPQSSKLYAVARLRMLRRQFLTAGQMQRLLSAPDYGQAFKVLQEAGYVQGDQVDWEGAAARHALTAARVVSRLSPDASLSDAFLLRHDIYNLKTFFKARILETEPEGISLAGTQDPERLRQAVAASRYQGLPTPIMKAMDALEKQAAIQADPMAIDVRLDRALFELMRLALADSPSRAARAWLKMKADFINLLAFLRLQRITASLSLAEIVVQGGSIKASRLAKLQGDPDQLLALYRLPYGRNVVSLAHEALENSGRIAELERVLETLLQKPFAVNRFKIDSPDAVVSYLLDVERQTAAIRLIMTGKRNGFSQEAIEERLRAGYGG